MKLRQNQGPTAGGVLCDDDDELLVRASAVLKNTLHKKYGTTAVAYLEFGFVARHITAVAKNTKVVPRNIPVIATNIKVRPGPFVFCFLKCRSARALGGASAWSSARVSGGASARRQHGY